MKVQLVTCGHDVFVVSPLDLPVREDPTAVVEILLLTGMFQMRTQWSRLKVKVTRQSKSILFKAAVTSESSCQSVSPSLQGSSVGELLPCDRTRSSSGAPGRTQATQRSWTCDDLLELPQGGWRGSGRSCLEQHGRKSETSAGLKASGSCASMTL